MSAKYPGVPFPRVDDVLGRLTRRPTVDDTHERLVPTDASVRERFYPLSDTYAILRR